MFHVKHYKKGVKKIMRMLLSPSWWISTIISTLVTMAVIVLIKKISAKYSIPVISTMAEEV